MMKMLVVLIVITLIVTCHSLSLYKLSYIKKTSSISTSTSTSSSRPLFALKQDMNTQHYDMTNNIKRMSAILCSSLLTLSPIVSGSIAIPTAVYADNKLDKQFELCISKCIFEETKPPPVGSSAERLEATKTRGEIVRECRVKCAKNKEQLLIGKPKVKPQQQAEPSKAGGSG